MSKAKEEAELFPDWQHMTVVCEEVMDGVEISTVRLEFPYPSLYETGTELWYETMVFGGPHDGWMMRHKDMEEAVRQHYNMVKFLLTEGDIW